MKSSVPVLCNITEVKDIKTNKYTTYFLIVYIIATLTVLYVFSIISSRWQQVNSTFDGLSKYYSDITIGHNRELIDLNQYNTMDLVDFLTRNEDAFRLQKKTNSNYSWIYVMNMAYGLDIIEGRTFEEADYSFQRNVALVSEETREKLYAIDNVYYINIADNIYEVVGIYRMDDNSINPCSDVLLSMCSENYIYTENNIEGSYYIDTQKDNKLLLNKLDEWCHVIDNGSVFEKNAEEKYQLVKDSLIISINILYMVVIFMLMCISFVTCFWLSSIKKEIFIHRLCGANPKTIIWKILKTYSQYVLVSFFIVMIFAVNRAIITDIVLVLFAIYAMGVVFCLFFSLKYVNTDIQKMK